MLSIGRLISAEWRAPAVHILLQSLIKHFLSDSYCLTYVSDEPIDFSINLQFTYITPQTEVSELMEQMLQMTEKGCSDYIVNIKDRKKFMTAFDLVSKAATHRRGDRKIIFLPLKVNNTESALDLFSMKEAGFVASIVVIIPRYDYKDTKQNYEIPKGDQDTKNNYDTPKRNQDTNQNYKIPKGDQNTTHNYETPLVNQDIEPNYEIPQNDLDTKQGYEIHTNDHQNCEMFDLVTHKFTGSREESHDLMLVNQWDSCSLQFKSNKSIFPHDLTNVWGKVVRVGTFSYLPYNVLDLEPGVTASGRDGVEMRVVEDFCRWINCSVEVVDEKEEQWGEVFPNGTGNGVIGSVIQDRADIGISGVYPWYEQFVFVDFSAPTVRASAICLAPSPRLLPSWAMPLRPFNWSMWLALGVTYLLATLALSLAGRGRPGGKGGTGGRGGARGNGAALTVLALMVTQSQRWAERSWRARSVSGWLLVTGLVLDSAYGGGLASTFTVPVYERSIDTLQELIDRGMEWAATHDAWVNDFTMSDQPKAMQLVKLYHTYSKEELRKKSFERKTAFGIEKLTGGHYAIGEYLSVEALADLTVMQEDLYFGMVIALLRKSSVYTEKLDVLIGRLQQAGLILASETQVALKHLDLRVQQQVRMSPQRNNADFVKALDLDNVVGIFMMYTAGVSLAAALFFAELLLGCRVRKGRATRARAQ